MEQIRRKGHRTKFIQFNSDRELFCYICKFYKDLNLFDENSENEYRGCKDRRCKQCKGEAAKNRRARSRGSKDLRRMLIERISGAKDRIKKSGLEFNITVESLEELWNKQGGKCAISGIQMTHIFGMGRIPTNLSVDRINSLKGYVQDNIQLVCMAVNQMKSDLSIEQLLYFCENITANARKWNH